VVQGVFAAMLVPGSLSILQSTFRPEDRASAIGTWAGVSGVAAAAGPLVGGFLIDHGGWRWIFAINVPLCIAVVLLARWVPESSDDESFGDFDVRGAVLGVLALGVTTYALTSWRGVGAWAVLYVVAVIVAWSAFVWAERQEGAMVPLELFASRVFTAANLMTFVVYGALGASLFLLVLQLQVTVGYGPTAAGLSGIPLTVCMVLLSSRMSALSERTGPRLPMTVGPLVSAVGIFLLSRIGAGATYWVDVFPGMLVFGLGMTTLVAPLTTAVLATAPDRHAGVASGINNAVARSGSLLAVAALPAAVGLSGDEYRSPKLLTAGFQHAELICVVLLVVGGVVSWVGLRNHPALRPETQPETQASTGGA
jgi:MFS family permease